MNGAFQLMWTYLCEGVLYHLIQNPHAMLKEVPVWLLPPIVGTGNVSEVYKNTTLLF